MASYSKWLTSKGLKSNAATGAQYRMSQGSDLTDEQYKKLGLTKGSDTMVDGVQTGTPAPDHNTIAKAIHKYSQNLLKTHQRKAQTGALAAVKPKPSNIAQMKDMLDGSLHKTVVTDKMRHVPKVPEPDTLVKDASGNVVSATGASASQSIKDQAASLAGDPGFSRRGGKPDPLKMKQWKAGPGNQHKGMHDAVSGFDWKKRGK